MEEVDKQKLLTQARKFNEDFDSLVDQLNARLLKKIRQGIIQPPRSYYYWEKKIGELYWYGENQMPEPDPKSLLYVGDWCYLENHPDVIEFERLYFRAAKCLRNNPFESTLQNSPDYQLYKSAIASQKVCLHDDLRGSHDDTGLLHMACLRVLAGGIAMYLDPLYLNRPRFQSPMFIDYDPTEMALEVGLGKLVYPSDKTISAAKRLIRNIERDGGTLYGLGRVEQTAKGEPFTSAKRTVPVKAMVREMTLLSTLLLNTYNGKRNRFPMSAIQHALNLVNDQTSKTQIAKYQALYDDSDEEPLSNITRDLVAETDLPF